MDLEIIEKYKKAGKIASQALAYGKELIKKDAKVLDVCNKVEEKIASLGALPAFPVQISMDSIALFSSTMVSFVTGTTSMVCFSLTLITAYL